MSVIDHLVPVLARPAYGASDPLASLPLNVWMKSTIRPMQFSRMVDEDKLNLWTLIAPPVWHYVQGDKEAFRYRVIMFEGKRRVEFGESYTNSQGSPSIAFGHSEHLLPKTQHAAFARTATVDPTQDYRVSGLIHGPYEPRRSILRSPSFKIAAVASIAYLLYRASTRRSSRGE